MVNVYFVAPFLMEATLRFVRGAVRVPDARIVLVTQEPTDRVDADLRDRLAGILTVSNALDAASLAAEIAQARERFGPPERLLGILEQAQVPLAEVRARLGIPGLQPAEALNFRDKSLMKDVLRQAGVPCARHGLAETASESHAFAQKVGYPLVIKPPAGAGAKSTHRVNREIELDEAITMFRPTSAAPMLLEEFVTGAEYSFDCVFIAGKPVWHSLTRYLPTPLEVLENPWIQWSVLLPREVDSPIFNDIRRIAVQALQALGMETGLSHLEWFRRDDGSIAISEVGARPPGANISTLTSYAHDIDLFGAWSHLMIHHQFTTPPRRYAAGAAYLRGQGSGRVVGVRGIGAIQAELGDSIVESNLPQTGQPAAGTYEGEGYIIVRHPETAFVERALQRIVTNVQVELG